MAIFSQIVNNYKKTRAKKRALSYLNRLKKNQNLKISSAYLFGSYAKGTSGKWSDIDVCVVSPNLKNIDALVFLWRNLTAEDSQDRIEPIGFDEEEFNEDTPSPIIHEIKKTGIRLI
ncbi:MAG: nucleotidyltransferase domain-containing protein [Candidatus Vogelbacteria bacterium]|nr:nucleotidyltransferase domain-containing protein [Candidatus Vogelbacteria bacterium]